MSVAELAKLGHTKRRTRAERPETPDNRAALGFLTPWLLGLVCLTLGPLIASLYLSFTNYNLLQNPSFIGLQNYEQMLTDPRMHRALLVTFTYVIIGVPLQLLVALVLAVLLDRGMRGLAFYRSAFYLPSLLGSSVAIASLWRLVFGNTGLVNQALQAIGINCNISWVASPKTALGTIILLHIWTFGSPMVIFLAGLRQIPREFYEASATDGATRRQQFRYVTVPMLTPIIFFNLILGVIGAFGSFTQAFIVSGGSGGPTDSTLFYTLYLYQEGFGNFRMGYASALAWVLVVIIAAFTALNFWVSKRWVHYDD